MTEVTYFRVAGDPNVSAPASVHKTCIVCNNEAFFLMTQDQYDRWIVQRQYAQNVFPHIDKDIREWMVSGTHPECWDSLFQDEDESDIITE